MKKWQSMLFVGVFSFFGCSVVLLNYLKAAKPKKSVAICKLIHTHSRATKQKIVARLTCTGLPQVKCLKVSAHLGTATSGRIDNALLLFSSVGFAKRSRVVTAGKRVQWFGTRSTRTLNPSGYLDAWMIFGSVAGAKKFVAGRKKVSTGMVQKGCLNIKL
jgi:hypothetical protein